MYLLCLILSIWTVVNLVPLRGLLPRSHAPGLTVTGSRLTEAWVLITSYQRFQMEKADLAWCQSYLPYLGPSPFRFRPSTAVSRVVTACYHVMTLMFPPRMDKWSRYLPQTDRPASPHPAIPEKISLSDKKTVASSFGSPHRVVQTIDVYDS